MQDEMQQDRARGVLVGLAAGDRNGGPVRMAACLAASLAALGRFDRADVLRRYLDWWRREGFDTGPVAARVFTLIDRGVEPNEAPKLVHARGAGQTAGCNPAHRAAPLAAALFLDDALARRCAREDAALTHHDPLAGDVAAATVALCRALVRGMSWAEALSQAGEGCLEITRAALAGGERQNLRRDGYAPAVLQAAVAFVGAAPRFDAALTDALDFAGPANYCPVLVGAIGGARWGASAMPADLWDAGATRREGRIMTDLLAVLRVPQA
ncbi:MAG TPA: ADP-ribosylglycohydrolase family protein [Roseiflexaceae bacterium]|nr:ADP-ribosylglycohydrolase family protein [Roseiflexaceae bacterium]